MLRVNVRVVRTARFSCFVACEAQQDEHERVRNVRYLKMLLFGAIPAKASSMDSSRMMILMFCVNSLPMLQSLSELSVDERSNIVEWIYSRQSSNGGFDGGSDARTPAHDGHLAMTYSAIVALVTLGDDLSRLNRQNLTQWLRSLQDADGSFRAVGFGSESDARFIYSAVATSFLIQDWSGINIDSAIKFILQCQNISDGGFGLRPGLESHGGATYICLASLKLLEGFDLIGIDKLDAAARFCVMRQDLGLGGYSGRCQKDCDTCYAYWIGGSLHVLGRGAFVHQDSLARYLDTTFQPAIGGFGKTSGEMPDPYHTHFGICARVLSTPSLNGMLEPTVGLHREAFQQLFQQQEPLTAHGKPYS